MLGRNRGSVAGNAFQREELLLRGCEPPLQLPRDRKNHGFVNTVACFAATMNPRFTRVAVQLERVSSRGLSMLFASGDPIFIYKVSNFRIFGFARLRSTRFDQFRRAKPVQLLRERILIAFVVIFLLLKRLNLCCRYVTSHSSGIDTKWTFYGAFSVCVANKLYRWYN